MSILKFLDQSDSNPRGKLYWGRSVLDGAPTRALNGPPILKEDEIDSRMYKRRDVKTRIFDLADAKQLGEYNEIMDSIYNGWFEVIDHDKRFVESTESWKALLIYAEVAMEEVPQGFQT